MTQETAGLAECKIIRQGLAHEGFDLTGKMQHADDPLSELAQILVDGCTVPDDVDGVVHGGQTWVFWKCARCPIRILPLSACIN